jgi:hypothetical protein
LKGSEQRQNIAFTAPPPPPPRPSSMGQEFITVVLVLALVLN